VSSGPVDWDARTYARASSPQLAWGEEVVERLALRGDEHVLDAGCGVGRVTELLAARLPRGRVLAVDGSPSMVDAARERLGDRADYLVADLAELEVPEPVDVVFSTATFHWVPDQERLFTRLFAVLRPGGRLVAQCGGAGNVAEAVAAVEAVAQREPFAEHLRPFTPPWVFATPEEATARLERAGFTEVEAWLQRKDARPEDLRDFVSSSVAPAQLADLPEALHAPFVDALLEELGPIDHLAYVRLNLAARRAR
jgi:trans-aconitate 2-methyltransferase